MEQVKDETIRNSSNVTFVNKVVHQNIELALKQIPERSPVLQELVREGKLRIIGAVYDIETGEVRFL